MRSISGPNGTFFGCTKYAAGCRGTRDAGFVQIEPLFLDWLKKMYPLPEGWLVRRSQPSNHAACEGIAGPRAARAGNGTGSNTTASQTAS